MTKRKADSSIGWRAVEELWKLFPDKSEVEIAKAIGMDRKTMNYWRNGETPSTFFLAKMHYLGADVIYILTGKRSDRH